MLIKSGPFNYIVEYSIEGSTSHVKTGNQYPPPSPPNTRYWDSTAGIGGTGYLFLHYRPPVDGEPAINVDKVNGYLLSNSSIREKFDVLCKALKISLCTAL